MKKFLQYFFHRDHLIITASAFGQLLILGLITFNIDFLNPIATALENYSITDLFFDIQHTGTDPDSCGLVTLVDMTDLHDRRDIAALLEELDSYEPLYMGVDLLFEGEKDDANANEAINNAVIGLNSQSVFSSKLVDYNSTQKTFTSSVRSFFANKIKINEAYTNLNDDLTNSRIRNFSISQMLNGERLLSFPAAIANAFDNTISDIDNNEILINYKNVCFPVVAYDELYENRDLIEGHIVLVGTMTEEQDMHNTPLGKMPGLEVQAYSLLTLLEHKEIKEAPKWLIWVLAVFICYLLEVTIDVLSRIVNKHNKSVSMVFLKESNLVSLVMLFLWMVVVCWLMFLLFVKHGIVISGGLILGLMALVCEGRDLYKAIIKALGARGRESRFIGTSLLKEKE